ncbi:unnamed protein product, partial [Staurois parvus]
TSAGQSSVIFGPVASSSAGGTPAGSSSAEKSIKSPVSRSLSNPQSLEFPLLILGHAVACMPLPDAFISSVSIPDLVQALRPL